MYTATGTYRVNPVFFGDPREKTDTQAKNRVNAYAFGFNGMEKDNQIKGVGNSLDFGARIYDSRLGRWLSIDPLSSEYPSLSPYNFVANNPIVYIDIDGEKFVFPENAEEKAAFEKAILELKNSSDLIKQYIEVIENSTHEVKLITEEYMPGGSFQPRSASAAATEGVGSGGYLRWNPNDVDIAPDEFENGSSLATKNRALLEELIHASRAVQGETELGDSKAGFGADWSSQWGNANEEISTNNIINDIMVKMDKPELQRKTYTMNFTQTDSEGAILDSKTVGLPLEVKKTENNGTPQKPSKDDLNPDGNDDY